MKNREVFKIGGDKEKMKKQIITLTAIVAILAAAIFAGCVEKETPVSTTNATVNTNTKTHTYCNANASSNISRF
jgi:ABC-type oligopeptide transport system substrate-binding subunit